MYNIISSSNVFNNEYFFTSKTLLYIVLSLFISLLKFLFFTIKYKFSFFDILIEFIIYSLLYFTNEGDVIFKLFKHFF